MGHDGRHIPNRIRKHRKLNGYTQIDVAFVLDMKSTNRISRWEKGISKPSIENLLKLALLFNILCEELYFDHRRVWQQEVVKKKEILHSERKGLDI